jgi:multicomponent Na+:H+ antiporter subunit E
MSSFEARRVLLVGGDAPAAAIRSSLAATDADAVVVLCRAAVAARVSADRSSVGSVTVESVDDVTAPAVVDRVRAGRFDRVDVVPGAGVAVTAIREALAEGDVAVPVSTADRSRRRRLRLPTGRAERAAIFLAAFGFYLLLGDLTGFDVATGAASALVVALLLARVTFVEPPRPGRTLPRLLRATLFLPYLLWQILRANVGLAAVLLDPRLPIDPSVERVETATESDLERAVLANSISLTPGTLTVDVRGSTLLVHALTASSRSDLRDGTLESAVRYVFAGRDRAGRSGPTAGGEVADDAERAATDDEHVDTADDGPADDHADADREDAG